VLGITLAAHQSARDGARAEPVAGAIRPVSELLTLARSIAIEAGALASLRRAEGVEVAATKSTVVDIVTEADREVERFILGRIADARPADGILGEEGGTATSTSGISWVIDPIDGTVNYLYGIPSYAVSIAVVEGDPDPLTWKDTAGVIFNPASGELYTGEVGGGAFLNDRPIRVAEPVELERALVATGFAYAGEQRARQGALIARLLPLVRDIRRQGTASLDLAYVAAGRVDAYFERTLSPWDHAAGAVIARAAGARVAGWEGAPPSRAFILAANPDLAERLEAALHELGETPGA
jgi:myo-inositol-1(or 4)-monophosphatase